MLVGKHPNLRRIKNESVGSLDELNDKSVFFGNDFPVLISFFKIDFFLSFLYLNIIYDIDEILYNATVKKLKCNRHLSYLLPPAENCVTVEDDAPSCSSIRSDEQESRRHKSFLYKKRPSEVQSIFFFQFSM